MATLDELIHYCRKEHTIGSLLLVGESGCGKTYLIENDLKEALKDTHFIVRVSLFGIDRISTLHDTIKMQWLYAVTPLFSKLSSHPAEIEKGRSFVTAVNAILQAVFPKAGNLGNTLMNSLDYIVVTPVVEDHITKTCKKVVLVFDDVERSSLDGAELLGCMNDYCENKHFNTIIIANRDHYKTFNPEDEGFIRSIREKTVAYTVINCPDYKTIIHNLIGNWDWKTEEYAVFLKEHEQTILEMFAPEPSGTRYEDESLMKTHNIRSLITSLESFYRVYYHLLKAGIADLDPYFFSFLAFSLAEKSGVFKNGKITYQFSDEEIGQLYPQFSVNFLFDSVRQWIQFGSWDRELFIEELSRVCTVDKSELMKDNGA